MAYNKETGLYEGFIYKITNTCNDKVYIGQTICTIKKRWNEHKSAARNKNYNNGQVLYRAMNKYGIDNFMIDPVEVVSVKTEEALFETLDDLEISYISKYNSLIPSGYNVTSGGSNVSCKLGKAVDAYDASGNKIYSFKTVGEAARFLGRDMSHVVRNCEGVTKSAYGYIWRYAQDNFDKYTVDITQNTLDLFAGRISIDKYDIGTQEYLGSYQNITDALRSIGRDDGGSSILQCLDNRRNTAFGYIWRYSNSDISTRKTGNLHEMPISVYDLNGVMIGTYKSISDAMKEYGLSDNAHSNIISCCKGKYKSAYGYIWRYGSDPVNKYSTQKRTRAIPINQYTLDGLYINTFESSTKLNKEYGFDRGKIINCCKHSRNDYKGYKWFYANDVDQPDKSKIIFE